MVAVRVEYGIFYHAPRNGGGRSLSVYDGKRLRHHLWQPLQVRSGWVELDGSLQPCPSPLEELFSVGAADTPAALEEWHGRWSAPFPPDPDLFAAEAEEWVSQAKMEEVRDAVVSGDDAAMPLLDFMINRGHPRVGKGRRGAVPTPDPEVPPLTLRETLADLVLCSWVCLTADPLRPLLPGAFMAGLAKGAAARLRGHHGVLPPRFADLPPVARLRTLGEPWSMRHHTRQIRLSLTVGIPDDLDRRAAERKADGALPETLAPFWVPREHHFTSSLYAVAWLDFWIALKAGLRLDACTSCDRVFLGPGGRHAYCPMHSGGGTVPVIRSAATEDAQRNRRIRRAYEKARQRADGQPFPDLATWVQGYPHRAGRRNGR